MISHVPLVTWIAALGLIGVTAACGRVGFELHGDGDGSVADAVDAAVGATDARTGDASTDLIDIDASIALCANEPGGLAMYLPFDEAAGAVAADASGNGNAGALEGMNDADWVAGRLGNGLDFDGNDDRVNAGSGASIDNLETITLCAWIFPRSYPDNYPTIADKSVDSFVGGWFFYLQDDDRFGFDTNWRKWAVGGSLSLNAWQHVCATWDGTDGHDGIRLYQNGAPVPVTSTGTNGNAHDSDANRDLSIGQVNNTTYPFDGIIDDFRIYGRVLSDTEVRAVYDCGG